MDAPQPDQALDAWNSWLSIAANAVLAASVIVGAGLALRRWNVTFALIQIDGPTFGESVINGVPQPKTTTWRCKLSLVHGAVAHVQKIKLQRRRFGFWFPVKRGSLPHEHMPTSISTGQGVELFVSIERGAPGPYRLKIDEYSSLRSVALPFLEPDKQNDFA